MKGIYDVLDDLSKIEHRIQNKIDSSIRSMRYELQAIIVEYFSEIKMTIDLMRDLNKENKSFKDVILEQQMKMTLMQNEMISLLDELKKHKNIKREISGELKDLDEKDEFLLSRININEYYVKKLYEVTGIEMIGEKEVNNAIEMIEKEMQ